MPNTSAANVAAKPALPPKRKRYSQDRGGDAVI